ncbi:multiheme c-type cytochrome [Planctomycetota bacterium]
MGRRVIWALSCAVVAGMAVWVVVACGPPPDGKPDAEGEYAGMEACKECHKEQYEAVAASLHRKYVQVATPETVIGDFETDNVLEVGGKKTTMIRRGGEFFVETTGPDGQLHEYRAEKTIGHHYKQRYETTLADGRRYVLPIQWNKNQKKWVDYHGLKKQKPGDGGYWCDPQRAIALKCAGCHGTGVRLVGDPPRIEEAEFTIGCEACHGPCADHCKDEKNPELIKAISLKSLSPQRQTDVCGKCHSRGEDPDAGTGYPYTFHVGDRVQRRFELVEPTIGKKAKRFWPDGRASSHHEQFIEFVTSAHYVKAGMSCLACHENHATTESGVLKDYGDHANALCVHCHENRKGDEALHAHTFHDPQGTGSVCVDCHMPKLVSNEQPFQLRHHGASKPNPNKALLWGAPDACSLCHYHKDKGATPQTMLDAMKKWGIEPLPIKIEVEKEKGAEQQPAPDAAARGGSPSGG